MGKTSLLNFIVGKKTEKTTPTLGVEYAPVVFRVGASDVRVNIWDTCKLGVTQQEQRSICR